MIKKTTIIIGLAGLIFVFGAVGGNYIAIAQETPLSRGIRSEQVKFLQKVLKEDPNIYPEGYVTGFFGPLTETAIKRLQKKFGIEQTGEIDQPTNQLLFPYLKVNLISPNGGEIWDRNEIQTISWSVAAFSETETLKEEKYFRPKASIDLFRKAQVTIPCQPGETCEREKSIFVKHIATVNLFDRTYSWKITRDIKNGKDYVIRISVGRKIAPFILEEKVVEPQEIWERIPRPVPPPHYIYWDESDEPFEISGSISPQPVPDLTKVIAILEKITLELQKAIALLRQMAR